MPPSWYGPTAHQQMNQNRMHQGPGLRHPSIPSAGAPPPPRIPRNINQNLPVAGPHHLYPPRTSPTLRGQQYHGPPRPMPLMPPSAGPPPHMQQKRTFVPHGQPHPSMRMGPYNDARHHGPPPEMRGRMPFPPHLRRPMPPQHMMHPGPHRYPQLRGMPPMGPHTHRLPPPGPVRNSITGPPESIASSSSTDSNSTLPVSPSLPPLSELQNENIPPPKPIVGTGGKQDLQQKVESTSTHNQDAAADAAEILLGLRTGPSPPPDRDANADEKRDSPPSVPDFPIVLPTRLAVPEDESKLNSMHCFLRSDLLELFVVERSTKSPKIARKLDKPSNCEIATIPKSESKAASASGRVGLRCVHCAKARAKNACSDGEAPMAVFYPKSISELYRLVTSWQRVHLRKCRNLPPNVREMYETTRLDKSRGKTQWWVSSARELGLVDCTSKAGGIRFKSAPYGLAD